MDHDDDTPAQHSATERQLRRLVVPEPAAYAPEQAPRRHPRTRPRPAVGRPGMSTPRDDVDDADRLARVKLSSAIEPGDLRVTGLVSELGAGKVLDYLEAAGEVENHWGFTIGQELAHVDPGKVLEQAAGRGIRFVIPGDAEWPDQLAGLRGAGALHDRGGEPVGLWIRGAGDLDQLAANAVAVVGSRAATSYGTHQATELSRDLATMGHTVVSGLAYGVDQAAHRGALLAGGPTIAVMPAGSTGPTRPRTPNCSRRSPTAAWSSPRRRREPRPPAPGSSPGTGSSPAWPKGPWSSRAPSAAAPSAWPGGPRHLHRPVMGVPGPVTSAASAGVNQLIRLGQASMVTTAQEVITDLTTHAATAAAATASTSPTSPGRCASPQPPAPQLDRAGRRASPMSPPRPCG